MDFREYQRVHKWIRRQFGDASVCSFDESHEARLYHWSNISGDYLYEETDWQQLCPSCHKKFDMTDEIRELNRIRAIGNKSHSTPVICIDDSKQISYSFPSSKEAAKQMGVLYSAISNCLTGRTKTSGGFRWAYKGVL